MTRFLFICHPADLEDEGLDAALARLRGEIGVDGIILRAATTARTALRPRVTDSPKIASHESAAWFQPDAGHYRGTRIRPHVAAAIKSRNLFGRICDAATSQGLSVRASIDLLSSAPVASKHPTATCVDIFGRPHESILCPSHPDVREFAAAVIEDLCANYPIDAIDLAGIEFGPYYPMGWTLENQVQLLDVGWSLINWCFCPACRQRAADSVDAGEVTRLALAMLNDIVLKEPIYSSFEENVAQREVLAAYARMRSESITSLHRMIRQRSAKPIWRNRSIRDEIHSGFDMRSANEWCDGFWVSEPDSVEHAALLAIVGTPQRITAEFGPVPESAWLVSNVHDAAQRNYAAIAFGEYGLASPSHLDWVRQAIRYARRESTT